MVYLANYGCSIIMSDCEPTYRRQIVADAASMLKVSAIENTPPPVAICSQHHLQHAMHDPQGHAAWPPGNQHHVYLQVYTC